MKKNSFFNFGRFGLLMRNELLLNYKQYLITLGGAFVLFAVIIYMVMSTMSKMTEFGPQGYMYVFILCMLGLGAFIGSGFPFLSNKRSLSVYLLTPASIFEKYLSQFVIRFIAGGLLFLVLFYIDAYLVRAVVLNANLINGNFHEISYFSLSGLWHLADRFYERITFVLMLVSLAAYLFAVKLFFRKAGLLKTIISINIPVMGVVFFAVLLSHLFSPSTSGFDVNAYDYKISDNLYNFQLWMYLLASTPWLFLFPLGYYKLKEKQL